jgi:hypothetical protein
MKKLFLLVIISILMIAPLAAQTPTNNLFWSARVKIKLDKRLEYEKKLPAFLKAHYPNLKFRVYEVISGENTGSYFIASGPYTFKDFDTPPVFPKGEALMKTDGQAMDALSESFEVNYARRVDEISNLKPDRKLKFIEATTYEIIPGTWGDMMPIMGKANEARKKGNSKIDVDYFRPASSGIQHSFTAVRYFEKWEELDLQENLVKMYDDAHGYGMFSEDSPASYKMVRNSKVELRVLRGDLSSM